MAVTEDELQEKRQRNDEAKLELQRLEDERVAAEQAAANDLSAQKLDEEYERIQQAIAQAKGLNAKADEKPAEKVAIAPTPVPGPEPKNAEGK